MDAKKIDLVMEIGNQVCESCPDEYGSCGVELKDCMRIKGAIKSLDEYLDEVGRGE